MTLPPHLSSIAVPVLDSVRRVFSVRERKEVRDQGREGKRKKKGGEREGET